MVTPILAQTKKEVTYKEFSNGDVQAVIYFDNKEVWNHYLSADEVKLYNSNNKEVLLKKFVDFAIKLVAEQIKSTPTVIEKPRIELTPSLEAIAITKQKVIDDAAAAAKKP